VPKHLIFAIKEKGVSSMQVDVGKSAFWVRSHLIEQDKQIVDEVYGGDYYCVRALAEHLNPRVIVDIGAHIGAFTRLAKELFPDAQVYALEPNPFSFELLRMNTAGLRTCTVIEKALVYDRDRDVLLLAEDSTGGPVVVSSGEAETILSSTAAEQGARHSRIFFEPDGSVEAGYDPGGTNERYHRANLVVAGTTLEALMKEYAIEYIDLLKLDCEGCELAALNLMDSATPDKIGVIVGEYHLRAGAETFRELFQSRFPHHHLLVRGEAPFGLFWAVPGEDIPLPQYLGFYRKRPRQVPGYQVEMLDGEMVLFHPTSLIILHCNTSGALIWQLCDGQRTVADIIELLSAAYPESATEIQTDVYDTLLTFVEQGTIEWV